MTLQTLAHEDGLDAHVLGGILVLHYTCKPSAATLSVLERVARTVFADPAARLGVIAVVEADTPTPDGPTRDEIARLMKQHQRSIAALAQVVLGTGFGAAAVRAVFTGLDLVARPAYPLRVFATVAEAVAWFARNGVLDAAQVAPVADQLAAAVAKRA